MSDLYIHRWSDTLSTFDLTQGSRCISTQNPCLAVEWHARGSKLKACRGMKGCLWTIWMKEARGGVCQRTELWEGRKQRKAGVGWDIKKIVSAWLMVLYGSPVSSDGQDDWQRVWPLVTVHHLRLPPPADAPLSDCLPRWSEPPKHHRLNTHSSSARTRELHHTRRS